MIRLLLALAVLFAPRVALAFHAGSTFAKPPGAGGGGGLFYVGAQRERGMTCNACHLGAEGRVRVDLGSDQGLFDGFRYTPGKTYQWTATLVGEHAGIASSTANFNGIAISVADARGKPAGTLNGPSDKLLSGGAATLVSTGQEVGATQWTFSWTAPDGPVGPVTIYLGAVDGDAAGAAPGETLTDPWNDDVYAGTLTLGDGSTALRDRPVPPLGLSFGFAAVFAVALRRKRKDPS